jgi:LPXTG-motif cell wall-anchored protein
LGAVGPGLPDVSVAEVVAHAREVGVGSGLLAGRDRAFYAAASLVGEKGRPGAPVVLVGAPLDAAAFKALAEQTGDAIGLSDGTRLLEAGGPEGPKRALSLLVTRPGRGLLLDETGAWAGTMLPVGGKLSLLSVFAAPPPPASGKTAAPLLLLGGAMILAGASLLLRSRRRSR